MIARSAKSLIRLRPRALLALAVTVLVAATVAPTRADEPAPAPPAAVVVEKPALRLELLARVDRDQSARKKLIEQEKELGQKIFENPNDPAVKELLLEIRQVDADNRQWLKQTIEKQGWPTRSMVGVDGAHAAWLLVQHADRDLPFQQECLKLMSAAAPGEVELVDVAYLTDRTRLAEGRGQLYGTQVDFKNGQWVPRNVEDPARLDERRKSVGLPPFMVYLQMLDKMYGPAKQPASADEPSK